MSRRGLRLFTLSFEGQPLKTGSRANQVFPWGKSFGVDALLGTL
jgi:hypothetical protein